MGKNNEHMLAYGELLVNVMTRTFDYRRLTHIKFSVTAVDNRDSKCVAHAMAQLCDFDMDVATVCKLHDIANK